jgi:hypothetical protein
MHIMLFSFGWFFAGGIVVFSGGAAFCFFLLPLKNQFNQKKKDNVPLVGGYNKHDSKKPRRAGVGKGKKDRGNAAKQP